MRPLSVDLRERVVKAYETTPNYAELARRFLISESAVRNYVRTHQAGQSLQPKPYPGRAQKLSVEQHAIIQQQVEAHPDLTLQEHADLFFESTGIRVSFKTMDRTLDRLNITRKKDRPRR